MQVCSVTHLGTNFCPVVLLRSSTARDTGSFIAHAGCFLFGRELHVCAADCGDFNPCILFGRFDGAEIIAKSHHKETGRLKYFPRSAARNRIGAKKF